MFITVSGGIASRSRPSRKAKPGIAKLPFDVVTIRNVGVDSGEEAKVATETI
jgi:hypothetical protein